MNSWQCGGCGTWYALAIKTKCECQKREPETTSASTEGYILNIAGEPTGIKKPRAYERMRPYLTDEEIKTDWGSGRLIEGE